MMAALHSALTGRRVVERATWRRGTIVAVGFFRLFVRFDDDEKREVTDTAFFAGFDLLAERPIDRSTGEVVDLDAARRARAASTVADTGGAA